MDLTQFIRESLQEDVGSGDHTSLSTIPSEKTGKAKLLVKDEGVIAGVELAKLIFYEIDPEIKINILLQDGAKVKSGDLAFTVEGSVRSILMGERLVLNCMQRMSGIATTTAKYVAAVAGMPVKILDTRKTTPLFRHQEKWAVRIGGGFNHRIGLYDMILIKDNHVDSAGGIRAALERADKYRKENKLDISIEIETRNLNEVQQVLEANIADRIMLDNFQPELIRDAVALINKKVETEASGGITIENIQQYASTGVDYISVGALTHSVKSLDLSLKIFN
ncbi:carboxylating nicotinate-nucleotide diphosphorylase [soil metagenome]